MQQTSFVNAMTLLPDGKLAVGHADSTISVWE
jgi:hypothetical protein